MRHAATTIISINDLKKELAKEYGNFFKNLSPSAFRNQLINGDATDASYAGDGSYLLINTAATAEGGYIGLVNNVIKAFLRKEFPENSYVLIDTIIEENYNEH